MTDGRRDEGRDRGAPPGVAHAVGSWRESGTPRPGGRGRRGGGARVVALVTLVGALFPLAACADGGAEQRAGAAPDASGARDAGAPGFQREAPPFDADSAFALLARQVAFGPRVPGTEGHAAQLEWMTSYLEARADTVILQRFEHTYPGDNRVTLTNVFARFRPGARDRILLVAHWDTRPTADYESDPERRDEPIPGANDGASGTAVLLQLADVLSSHSPPVGVDLLLTDGEDYAPDHMYLGAEHFAANLPAGYSPLYGILLDMVADRDPRYPKEGYSVQHAPEVVARVWRMAERLGYRHHFPDERGIAVSDDHLPLNRAGIPTINIIDFDYGPGNAYWHTLDDSLENVSPTGLGVVGDVVAELLYRGG